jgi:hypothetical protein
VIDKTVMAGAGAPATLRTVATTPTPDRIGVRPGIIRHGFASLSLLLPPLKCKVCTPYRMCSDADAAALWQDLDPDVRG